MYYFLNNPRMQLFFLTPNHCAVFFVVASFLLFGIILTLFEKRKWFLLTICSVIFSLMFCVIVLTYSRGAWISVFFSMLFFICREIYLHNYKYILKYLSIPLCLFVFLVFVVPSASKRLCSVAEINTDLSIKHRLYVWKGAFGVIARAPLLGHGVPPAAGKYYTMFYQNHFTKYGYYTLVSDYFSIAASFGLIVFSLLIFFLALILMIVCNSDFYKKSAINLYAGVGIISQLICSCFSTFCRFPLVLLPFAISLIIVLVNVIKHKKYLCLKKIILSIVFSVVTCVILYLAGFLYNYRLPYRIIQTGRNFEIISYNSKKNIVILTNDTERDLRLLGRPLAQKSFSVKIIHTEGGIKELKRLSTLFDYQPQNDTVLFAVTPELGLLAVALGRKTLFSSIAIPVLPETWPFDELSPDNVKYCKNVLYLHSNDCKSVIEQLVSSFHSSD